MTHKNVPPEKRSSIPVRHSALDPSPPEEPTMFAKRKVTKAPTGAARLKTKRWALAVRLDSPCFRSTEVNPNEAGALCTIIAKNMMKLSPVSELEAPKAIPSAAA